jgi:lipid-A-disaccharide synthase
VSVARSILISAGEASSDLYAAALVDALRRDLPDTDFFGCAGPRMRASGVHPVVKAESLSVVGLVEVVGHVPRIYAEYRRILRAAAARRPEVAILTDSPDFHLRLAGRLARMGVPVVYLIAPQAWAWREGRVRRMRRTIARLLCIFPFEEDFFRKHGVNATYIGHPLARLARPSLTRADFLARHGLRETEPLIALLPGSRTGEAMRHVPALLDAVRRIVSATPAQFVLALPPGFRDLTTLRKRLSSAPIKVIEGETWDVLAHADLALAASGTVTIEAALLGAPMVTFYKVTNLSWLLGRFLVKVPFFSMVNLVAGRAVVPELMQNEMSGERLASEALNLLNDPLARSRMRQELRRVAAVLAPSGDPMERAAGIVEEVLRGT